MDITTTARPARLLRAAAVAACLPYLCLKTAWVAGSTVGIPDGSELLENRAAMAAVNLLTVLMDATVVVLAFALTRPWGRRLPAWLVAGPLWLATGLLAPIVLGFPLQTVAGLLGGGGSAADDGEPFLDGWVFTVVYTGFGIQALALGGLFVLYVRGRWGRLLRGRMGELPPAGTAAAQRLCAGVVTAAALLLAAVHLAWAVGTDAGLSATTADDRTSSFHITESLNVAFALAAAAGALLLAFRPLPRVRLTTAGALGWTGGAALAAWGGWTAFAALLADGPLDLRSRPSQAENLTYAGGMVVGLLVLTLGAHLLAERAQHVRPVSP